MCRLQVAHRFFLTSAGGGGHAVPAHQDGDANVRTIWITLDAVDKAIYIYDVFVRVCVCCAYACVCVCVCE